LIVQIQLRISQKKSIQSQGDQHQLQINQRNLSIKIDIKLIKKIVQQVSTLFGDILTEDLIIQTTDN